MKKIYIVIWRDRHTEPTATPFADLNDAKVWAHDQAKSVDKFDSVQVQTPPASWLHLVTYGEGCSLWITEHEVNL